MQQPQRRRRINTRMWTSGPPDFEAVAAEDAQRIARLQLEPHEELRVAAAYDHWLMILFAEARKQLDTSGRHPCPITAPVPGRDVRRNVILDWEVAPPELFAQIWIDTFGEQAKVLYRFVGRGYATGEQVSF